MRLRGLAGTGGHRDLWAMVSYSESVATAVGDFENVIARESHGNARILGNDSSVDNWLRANRVTVWGRGHCSNRVDYGVLTWQWQWRWKEAGFRLHLGGNIVEMWQCTGSVVCVDHVRVNGQECPLGLGLTARCLGCTPCPFSPCRAHRC